MGVISSLNALYNSPVKLSGPELLCVRSVLITVPISSAVIGLLRLCVSSSLNFGRLYLSKNLFNSPRFSNFLAYSSS